MIFFPSQIVMWRSGSKLGNIQRKWIWGECEEKALSKSPTTQKQLHKIALTCESLQLFIRSKADVQNVPTGITFLCFHLWDNLHISKLIHSATTVLYHTNSPDMLKRWEVSTKDNILVKLNCSNRIKARNFSRTLQTENVNSKHTAANRTPLIK